MNKRNSDILQNNRSFMRLADRGREATLIVSFALMMALALLAGRIASMW